MPQYRKKPVAVDAVQFTGINHAEIMRFTGNMGTYGEPGTLRIPTLEGVMTASPSDWIIKGIVGELYPCRDDIFRMTYEPLDAPRAENVA